MDTAAPLKVTLTAPPPLPSLPSPDEHARAVIERVHAGGNVVVLGAGGTGKTTLATHLVLDAGARGKRAVLMAPTRVRADALRSRVSRLGTARGAQVRVTTPSALALSVVSTWLTRRADPLPAPVLLGGAEEDAVLASLLDPADWAPLPEQTVCSRAFRTEVRNLLARCGELGVSAEELSALGRELGVPLWERAAVLLRRWEAQGKPSAQLRGVTRRLDSARVQDRAVEALAGWGDDLLVPRPVPDLVVVDDYQDCTQATARLLAALAQPDQAGVRAQVVVLGNPDVAVETFRGGTPSLLVEAEDSTTLDAQRLSLGTCYRGGAQLQHVCASQADRIPVAGTARYRHPEPAPLTGRSEGEQEGCGTPAAQASPADTARQAPSGVEAMVVADQAQEYAHVARVLRSEHVHHATGWERMLVVARSSDQATQLGRELARRGVPLAASVPAVLLRSEPAAAALLDVVRDVLDGLWEEPYDSGALHRLLTGRLVGLGALDLRRVRRDLRQRAELPEHARSLAGLVADVQAASRLADRLAGGPLAPQLALVARAARIVQAVRQEATGHDASGEADHDQADQSADIEALLWAAWQASGCAEQWRRAALDPQASSSHTRALMAEHAEHELDVVTALFKRAEVWAERHPGAGARAFLDQLDAELVPSDSVAPHGSRPAGVSVLTPAAAAGGQWEVVVITGLVEESWPDLRLRDSLMRAGLLVDAVTGRLPVGEPGAVGAAADPAARRAQVRADERRMLVAAMSRATRRLVLTSVDDAEHTPSSFFAEVARDAGACSVDADGAWVHAPIVTDLTLRGLVGQLRAALVAGHLPEADAEGRKRAAWAARLLSRLAQEGVDGASPASWLSLLGPSTTKPLVGQGQRVRVSPSDVELILSCPLKWFLQRNGAASPPSAAQERGVLIHALAEAAVTESLTPAQVIERGEADLARLDFPDTWMGEVARGQARDLVTRLAAYLASSTGQALVEQRVDADLTLPGVRVSQEEPDEPATTGQTDGHDDADVDEVAAREDSWLADMRERIAQLNAAQGREDASGLGSIDVHLAGRIDRLEILDTAGKRVRLIDFKTGARVYADPFSHPQLATYRLALDAQGYDVDGAALVLLGKKPSSRTGDPAVLAPRGAALDPSPRAGSSLDWARINLSWAAHAASGAHLLARSGSACRTCPVQDSCPIQPASRRTVA